MSANNVVVAQRGEVTLIDQIIEQAKNILKLEECGYNLVPQMPKYHQSGSTVGYDKRLIILTGKNRNGEIEKWVIKYGLYGDIERCANLYYNPDIRTLIEKKLVPEGVIGTIYLFNEKKNVCWLATRHVGSSLFGRLSLNTTPSQNITLFALALISKPKENEARERRKKLLEETLKEYFDPNTFDAYAGSSLEDTIREDKGSKLAQYLVEKVHDSLDYLEEIIQYKLTEAEKEQQNCMIQTAYELLMEIGQIPQDKIVPLIFVPQDMYTRNMTVLDDGTGKKSVFFIDQFIRSKTSPLFGPPEEIMLRLDVEHYCKYEPMNPEILERIKNALSALQNTDSKFKNTPYSELTEKVLNYVSQVRSFRDRIRTR